MIVVDTGVLLAVADQDDRWHIASKALLDSYPSSQLILPADMNLGTVDASVIAIAERLNIVTLATINLRDFRVVRPVHCDAFELVPTR